MNTTTSVWAPDVPFPRLSELRLADRISHVVIHRGIEDFQFLHESSIAHHRNSLFVAWNNSPVAESEKGTVVRWIRSDDDFASWSTPAAVAPMLDHETVVWESCQLLSVDERLWAFVGQVHLQPRRSDETGGRTVIFLFDDAAGEWREQGSIDGFHPLNRPQQAAGGNWVMGGQFNLVLPRVAISRGSDFSGWDVCEIPSTPGDCVNYAETSLAVGESVITAYVRSATAAAYVSQSHDDGRSWSPLCISNLPMSSSKTCAGVLSSGQRYLAFNMKPEADGVHSRDVLAMAVANPGEHLFCRIVIVRKGKSPSTRFTGFVKSEQWSYPSVLEHDGKVYVTYSVTKEDCCLSILPLDAFSV
ncbi:MAG: exo-alpha-sialidase [Lentisphaeria bacterium]|nr:exo-alpha-sialidase [Lentisphaeria bacterium]